MSVLGSDIPLEYFMVGGIGFLAAWLTALMVMPAVHQRAVRLTRRKYDQLPLSVQEMRAEKDTIRASFAAATRQLEMSVEQLREKTAAHAADLARKTQMIARLKQELEAVDAALAESQAREQAARTDLREARRELAAKDIALSAAEQDVASIKAEIAAIVPALLRDERYPHAHPADVVTLAPQRMPLDVVPPPTRLLPPAPQMPAQRAQQHDDSIMRAWTEIRDAARRLDGHEAAPAFGRRPNGAAKQG